MKVRIRKYRWHWWCNYWPLNKLSDWYDKRRVKVKYDYWDTWNLDYTLAVIILPGLKQLKETNHGMPWVDNDDLPQELWINNGDSQKEYYNDAADWNDGSRDTILSARWDYVMDQMILAFEMIVDDSWEEKYFKNGYDKDGHEKEFAKQTEGLRLFGKYYRSLWV